MRSTVFFLLFYVFGVFFFFKLFCLFVVFLLFFWFCFGWEWMGKNLRLLGKKKVFLELLFNGTRW